MSFRDFLNEGKTANKDTQVFVKYMLDDEYFFKFINDSTFDGKPDFIKRHKKNIETYFDGVLGKPVPFNVDKVQSGWVYNQLELGGLDITDFKKDFSDAL